MKFLDHHSINYVPEDKADVIEDYEPRKRRIIVKDSYVSNEEDVKAYALLLSQYLVQLGEFRVKVDMGQVEEVIINDFIHLDSFIHKIWTS